MEDETVAQPPSVKDLRAMFESNGASTEKSTSSTTKPRVRPKPSSIRTSSTSTESHEATVASPTPSTSSPSPALPTKSTKEAEPDTLTSSPIDASLPAASSIPLENSQPDSKKPPVGMKPESHVSSPSTSVLEGQASQPQTDSPRLESPSTTKPVAPPRPRRDSGKPSLPSSAVVVPNEMDVHPPLPPRRTASPEKAVAPPLTPPTRRAAPPRPAAKSMHAVPERYTRCFQQYCTSSSGTEPMVRCDVVRVVWLRSRLPSTELAAVWQSVAGTDPACEGLTESQFTMGLRLIDAKLRRLQLDPNASAEARMPPPALPSRPSSRPVPT